MFMILARIAKKTLGVWCFVKKSAQLGHSGVREDWVAINIGLPAQPGCHGLEGRGIVLGRVEDERVGPARSAGRVEVAWSSGEAHGTG